MFIAKIKRTVKKHCMLEPGEKVVVGVSGGPDSMALLSVLHQMQEKYNLQLVVAHLNHGFRGKEAARDAQFVQERAQGCSFF
jgi:tRNA(Ile)-lysidine synthase